MNRLHLFQGYGIELEYMIVDRQSLQVLPVADKLLELANGTISEDFENGDITWSNELVLHVIELKSTVPTADLMSQARAFHKNIEMINELLGRHFNARLMPTAAHPWMDPLKHTFLWPHGASDIYQRYNEIFDCKGHGWSNLQSMHINLPFYDNEEFAVLHAAVRVLLPILPALAASSPILDGNFSGKDDKRLDYYRLNQQKIPSITGKVIPERVNSRHQYLKLIYAKIAEEVSAYNADQLLNPVWLNSRGAIARFDRGSLEIRLIDLQECPYADVAIAALVIETVKQLVNQKMATYQQQQEMDTHDLYQIFLDTIRNSSETTIKNTKYLKLFGVEDTSIKAIDLWKHIAARAGGMPDMLIPYLKVILEKGTLSRRIQQAVNGLYTGINLKLIYQELCENLEENKMFVPCDHSILL